jgi:hypothetical protein
MLTKTPYENAAGALGAPADVREAFRLAVLDALDTTARRALHADGVHAPGASDGDLPALFRAIDAHADILTARYGARPGFRA